MEAIFSNDIMSQKECYKLMKHYNQLPKENDTNQIGPHKGTICAGGLEGDSCSVFQFRIYYNIFSQNIYLFTRDGREFDYYSPFRNKRFMIDDMFRRNPSKFAILLEYENPCSFFVFHFV